jgi:hypothetical protein
MNFQIAFPILGLTRIALPEVGSAESKPDFERTMQRSVAPAGNHLAAQGAYGARSGG